MKSQVDVEFFIAIGIFAVTLILVAKGITQMISHEEITLPKNCELVIIKQGVGVKCDNARCIYVEGNFVKFVGNLNECWNGKYKVISSNISLEETNERICMHGNGEVKIAISDVLYKEANAIKFIEDGPFVVGC